MKILYILLLIVSFAYGQYQTDTVRVSLDLPGSTPQEVIDQVGMFKVFAEHFPQGQQAQLFSGMSLAQANAVGGTTVQQGVNLPFSYSFPANGDYYTFCAFALTDSGQEIRYMLNEFNRYDLRSGTAFGQLSNEPEITIHNIYVEVIVR